VSRPHSSISPRKRILDIFSVTKGTIFQCKEGREMLVAGKYPDKSALHIRKRAQYIHKRAQYIRKSKMISTCNHSDKSAQHICERALYIHNRALHIRKRALHIHNRALNIRKKALYIHEGVQNIRQIQKYFRRFPRDLASFSCVKRAWKCSWSVTILKSWPSSHVRGRNAW